MDRQTSATDKVAIPHIPSADTDCEEPKSSSAVLVAASSINGYEVHQSTKEPLLAQPKKAFLNEQSNTTARKNETSNHTSTATGVTSTISSEINGNINASTASGNRSTAGRESIPPTTQQSHPEAMSGEHTKPKPPQLPPQTTQQPPLPSTVASKSLASVPAPATASASATAKAPESTTQQPNALAHHHLPPYNPYYYPPPYYYGYHAPPHFPLHHHPYHQHPYLKESKKDSADGTTANQQTETESAKDPPLTKEQPSHSTITKTISTNQPKKLQNQNGTGKSQTISNVPKNTALTSTAQSESKIQHSISTEIIPASSVPTKATSTVYNSDSNKQQKQNESSLKSSMINASEDVRIKSNIAVPSKASTNNTVSLPQSAPLQPRQKQKQKKKQPPPPTQQLNVQQNPIPVISKQQQKRDLDEALIHTPIKSNTTSTWTGLNIPGLRNPLDGTASVPLHATNTSMSLKHRRINAMSVQKAGAFEPETESSVAVAFPPLCKVTKPVVMVDQLTYDWSSLKLDGTKAWNQLLKQNNSQIPTNADTHSDDHPRVTALHTYQLMQTLKESLFGTVIAPNPDSPLHHEVSRQDDLSRVSDEVPENCPEELQPFYANAASFYRILLQERARYHQELLQNEPQPQQLPHPTLNDRYQSMTANELRQYMKQTKHEIASLNRKEQRVLNTARKLKMYPYTNKGRSNKQEESQQLPLKHRMYNDDEIRKRYNNHFRKRNKPEPELTKTNGASRGSATGNKILWQDDEISTLFKKHKP